MLSRSITSTPVRRMMGAVLSLALIGVSCGDDGPDDQVVNTVAVETTEAASGEVAAPAATVAPNGETVDVTALDNSFNPQQLEVVAGTAVHWENRGRNDHNVLPIDDTQQWGAPTEDFTPGDEYTVVFDTPGTYAYYCSIHGTKDVGMVGTVVVLAVDG